MREESDGSFAIFRVEWSSYDSARREIVDSHPSRPSNSAESAEKPRRATLLAELSAHHLIPNLPIMPARELVIY